MSIQIDLYNCTAEPNRIDKSGMLGTAETHSGEIKNTGAVDIVNPVVLLNGAVNVNANYAYISTFGRYYYIDEITSVRTGLFQVSLRCDPLMSFATDIMGLPCICSRSGTDADYNIYSKYIEDGRQKFQAYRKVLCYTMGDLDPAGTVPFILATVST